LDDGAPLDDIGPPNVWVQARKDLGRGFVQVRAAFYATDSDPGPTEVPTPSYQLLDASVGWKIGKRTELRFLARNLLDETYPLSSDKRAPFVPGVSGLATVNIEF
jgi:outer membrane receptor protein involved in Fe transport